MIASGMKENVNVIMQNNLSEKDLHDEKHIKKSSLWILVESMTNKIREVLDLPPVTRQKMHGAGYRSPPKPAVSNNGSRRNSTGMNGQSLKNSANESLVVNQLIGAMEHSTKMMVENMKDVLRQCFGT